MIQEISNKLFIAAIDAGNVGIPKLDANTVIDNVIGLVLTIAGMTAVLTIVIAGYMYTVSDGKPDEIAKSKNAVIYAVIGLIFVGSAFSIAKFIFGRFQ